MFYWTTETNMRQMQTIHLFHWEKPNVLFICIYHAYKYVNIRDYEMPLHHSSDNRKLGN